MADEILATYICNGCQHESVLQIDFDSGMPLQPGCVPFPEDNMYHCPTCGMVHDLSQLRDELEMSALEGIKKPIAP